jgi:Uri superfamily endonuclease
MPRKPKPYSVYVLQYKSSYSLKKRQHARNPKRHAGRPIVSIHTTGKPAAAEIAKKRARDSNIRLARQEPEYNRRFTSEQGALRCKDRLINELRERGWAVLNSAAPIGCSVYCLELSDEARPSAAQNANCQPCEDLPVLYVGQTGKTVGERIEDHLAGKNSNRWVRKYFVCERSDLVAQFSMAQPMTYRKSLQCEKSLADRLRIQGYGVRGGH